MNRIIRDFIDWAKSNNWTVEEKETESLDLNTDLISRYKQIPLLYLEFLQNVKAMISPDESTWFLCEDEYNSNSEIAFKWNEFELISLEAAEGDEEWISEISLWWDKKFPIIMSVGDGYSFYAINMSDGKYSVIRGCEPEFEEAELVASDLEEFLRLIMLNRIEL